MKPLDGVKAARVEAVSENPQDIILRYHLQQHMRLDLYLYGAKASGMKAGHRSPDVALRQSMAARNEILTRRRSNDEGDSWAA